MNPSDDLHDLTLLLPVKLRARLARQLLLSLEEAEGDEEYETAWLAEIEDRMKSVDFKHGSIENWSDGLERIRQSLAARQRSVVRRPANGLG